MKVRCDTPGGIEFSTCHLVGWLTHLKSAMVGRYVGTSSNPHKGVNEPVSGVRRQVIVDRGRGKPKGRRFVMRMNRDLFREGSLSYTRVSGKLCGD